MKTRNIGISPDWIPDELSFDEQCDCEYELKEKKPLPIKKALLISVMAISLGIVINGVSNANRTETYNAVAIEDSHWSDFDSTKINSYFDVLSSGTNYKMLEAMSVGSSTIFSTIQDNEGKMQNLYDEYYGAAQGIQKFGGLISVNHINGVSDNKVSLSINYVSEADLVEYFNENANDLCRFFTSHELSKENLVRELFILMDTYQISTSEKTIELAVEKVDGVWTIADDSALNDLLITTYNQAIQQMTKQISMHK